MHRLAAMMMVALVIAGAGVATASTSDTLLHVTARHVALHGGIRGSCYGCATQNMQRLSRRLVIERFSTAGSGAVRWALCVVGRESGFNPGAINSSSGAAGLFQFLGHPRYSYWMLTHDPVYQVNAAWSLSHHARDRSPWYGGGYSC